MLGAQPRFLQRQSLLADLRGESELFHWFIGGLPRYLPDALDKLGDNRALKRILGERFVELLLDVKNAEHDAYQAVISSWEREHLLLNV